MTYQYSPFTPIVVTTQDIENYADDKKENYWKFKGGQTFVVYGCNKMADAVSFISETFLHNGRAFKSFPTNWLPLDDFIKELKADNTNCPEYIDYTLETLRCVSAESGADREERKSWNDSTYYELLPEKTDKWHRIILGSIKENA